MLGVDRDAIVDSQWVDNGPGWLALLLGSVDEVMALRPGTTELDIGAVALDDSGAPEQLEVRAFFPGTAVLEDPVTGSLNASVAQWLLGDRPADRALRRAPGHRDRRRPAACTSARTPAEPCGWPAPRTR